MGMLEELCGGLKPQYSGQDVTIGQNSKQSCERKLHTRTIDLYTL